MDQRTSAPVHPSGTGRNACRQTRVVSTVPDLSEDTAVFRRTRRDLLATTAMMLLIAPEAARAMLIKGSLPWMPGAGDPPAPARPGPWLFFSADEAAAVEALVDRLIPPDPSTPGGKDVGCAVFIDRQLAGPQGRYEGRYMSGPFQQGTKEQGEQSPLTPAQHYRRALAALAAYCREKFDGRTFAQLSDKDKDEVITGLEHSTIKLAGTDGTEFFKLVLKDTQNGFFADPIYGGNKDMAAWKMIGFPGARYDYRDWVERHNERFPLPPVGIASHPHWAQ
jgi:gluconate 2-dehydrogenase gamma chain